MVASEAARVYTVGDTVWEDTNHDGVQETGEPGIAGVTVTLTKPDGTTVTTTTDANGNYSFTDLPNGDYTIDFTAPAGYVPTTTNVGDDALDSDGSTVSVTVNGADDMTIDSGFVKETYTIGDTVWEDTNHNGVQETGEPGIPGVIVTITNPDGTTETTTTDSNGHYEFTDKPNGEYTIDFTTPDGYTPTTSNTGDDSLDSDGTSVKVTVDGSDNTSIDSGFVKETLTPDSTSTTVSESTTTSTTVSESTSVSEAPKASTTAAVLPHTGSTDNTSLYGGAALAILAALGLGKKKRDEN